MFERLKKRWDITSNKQVVLILVAFAINGSATVYLKKMVFGWIGITSETELIIRIPVYVFAVLIIYNVLLPITGFLLGQFRFFWAFEKKFFSRFFPRGKSSALIDFKTEL
jgi:hypothetical protein